MARAQRSTLLLVPEQPRRHESRAEQVKRNDGAIRAAVADTIVESGWDGIAFSAVAKRAGLTVGAVYGRAESPSDLAIDLWEHEVSGWLRQTAAAFVEAATSGDPAAVGAAFGRLDAATKQTALLTELLIAAIFDVDLGEVVLTEARQVLSEFCTPSPGGAPVTAQQAAGSALVFSFAFGRALAARGGRRPPRLTPHQLTVLGQHATAAPYTGPVPVGPPLRWTRDLTHLDEHTAALMEGTLRTVGRIGFRRATISKIARASGVARGSVLSHFDDKVALVAYAAHVGLVPPGEVWTQYDPVVKEYGPLISRASFLRDFLKPDNADLWALNLELARIAAVEPRLSEFDVPESTLEHTHLGVMLLASIVPGLQDLPYAGAFLAGSAT